MNTATQTKETLTLIREHKSGPRKGIIEAIHHWPTGWQLLDFPNREAFDKLKAKADSGQSIDFPGAACARRRVQP